MKTILEHLQDLPKGIRERAIKNYHAETRYFYLACRAEKYPALAGALLDAFLWDKTTEGDDYWDAVKNDNYEFAKKFLTSPPPLPTTSESKIAELEAKVLELEGKLSLADKRAAWKDVVLDYQVPELSNEKKLYYWNKIGFLVENGNFPPIPLERYDAFITGLQLLSPDLQKSPLPPSPTNTLK